MMTQTKYIPCTESDIRIGQVVEVYHSITGEFHQYGINEPVDARFSHAMLISTPNLTRVSALSHKDILDLGWEFQDDVDDCDIPFKFYDNGNFVLHWCYTLDKNNISISEDTNYLDFTIRTKLELQDLMRFLGIATKYNAEQGSKAK